jgi:tetratricopeptide (TPR) repeat protein
MFATFFAAVALMLSMVSSAGLLQGRNSIEGRITTPDNKPLENVRVFLLNDTYGNRGQTTTDGSGRYQFNGLGAGNYYVQVEPAGTGYERQTQRIEVNPFDPMGAGAFEIFRLDIALKRENPPSGSSIDRMMAPEMGVVFVQNIPATAREAYQKGIQSLKKDDLKMAEVELTHAIQIFPDYFDALEMLGTEYVKHAFYDASTPLLAHAVEVNKSAWRSYYGLGVSLLELGKRQEGIDSLRRSLEINPKSINAGMRLGLELAKDGQDTDEAIKVLSNVTQMAGKQLPEAYLVLASLHSKNKHYKLAAEALESYLQIAPTSAQRESIKLKIEELRKKENSATNNK